MRLFQEIAESLGFATKKRAQVHPNYEAPNLSQNATVASIQSAIRAAESGGETRNLFALYRDLTVGGSHIQAELNKRILATLAQPMSVLPAEEIGGKRRSPQLAAAEDLAAAAAVQQMISDCENWTDGLTHVLGSCLWPVAVVEKIFRPVEAGEAASKLGLKYTLKRLEPVNPQLLCFKKPIGSFRTGNTGQDKVGKDKVGQDWEPDLRFYSTDEEGRVSYGYEQTYGAEPGRHLVHRGHMLAGVRDNWGGPMRSIVFWWLLSVLARDWFGRGMERWGSPFPVGHTDAKNPQAIALLQEAFALSTKIGGLVVDHETQVELKEIAAAGMADAYERFLNVCNREVSKVIVGQTLSAEAQSTGLGSSVGTLHSDVREDIRMFDQLKLAETIRQQLFRQCLQINGLRGAVPRPAWGGISDEDAKLLSEVLSTLATAGWEPTDEAVPTLSDRFGFPIQRKAVAAAPGFGWEMGGGMGNGKGETADEVRSPKSEVRSEEVEGDEKSGAERRTPKLAELSPRVRGRLAVLSQQGKMADALGVPSTWLNPLREFLEELQAKASDRSLSEQDLLSFLDQAVKRVPELFREMDVDELARVMEAGMGEAVLQEVRRGMRSPKSEVRS